MRWLMRIVAGGVLMSSALVCVPGRAEAGVGDWVKNSVSYLFTPVNCVLNFGKAVVGDAVTFVGCVVANANRNPATLKPVLPPPVPQPGS